MTTFNDGESGLSVRNKINAVLQHADGTAGELVINDAGADVDFRVESDTNANAFFVDGVTGNVGIGASSPTGKLAVVSGSSAGSSISNWANYAVFGPNAGSSTGAAVGVSYNTSSDVGEIASIAPGVAWKPLNLLGNDVRITTNNAERMRIDSSGNVGIGTSSVGARLDVNSAGSDLLRLERTANNGVYASWKRPNKEYILALDINNNGGTDFSLYDVTAAATRLTVDGSGNLLIGTATSGASRLRISGLPTSSAGLSAGDVWNDGGTLKIA